MDTGEGSGAAHKQNVDQLGLQRNGGPSFSMVGGWRCECRCWSSRNYFGLEVSINGGG